MGNVYYTQSEMHSIYDSDMISVHSYIKYSKPEVHGIYDSDILSVQGYNQIQ